MGNRTRPISALFPVKTEFPESRKMSENFDGNAAIYEFFDYLLERGYVLARREPESGQLRAMKVRPTVEYEVLMFRGVDRIAYAVERDAMRAAYPHLWARYGLSEEAIVHDALPDYADEAPAIRRVHVDRSQPKEVDDDTMLSIAEAWRQGVFTMTPSHSGVRVKIARCRRLYPDLMPRMVPHGSLTLYRVGDLRRWEEVYTQRAAEAKAGILFDGGAGQVRQRDLDAGVPEQPVAEVSDALAFLMGKIRGDGSE